MQAPGNANRRFRTGPGRVGRSSRDADGGRCRRPHSQSRRTRIAPCRRPLV